MDRLLLGNEFFGDSVELVGITKENGELVVFTEQPTVVGVAAPPSEIIQFMDARWLKQLDGLKIGHEGALCFYRDLDQVAVFDAHSGNVLQDQNGVILPIDLIVLKADEALAGQLEMAL